MGRGISLSDEDEPEIYGLLTSSILDIDQKFFSEHRLPYVTKLQVRQASIPKIQKSENSTTRGY
jgi:hypothetical protein